MKSANFEYLRPTSLPDALDAANDETTFLAGGQSLMAMLNLRVTSAETMIDLSRLSELRGVNETPDAVTLGALTTHAMIEDGAVPDPSGGLMPRIASKIAYRAVRNMGTIGGSLALADPAADWPCCLLALDATVLIEGATSREEAIEDFLQDAYTTTLEAGEIIRAIRIPRNTAPWGVYKVTRKSGAFADSLAICVLGDAPRIALTGTQSRAQRLRRAESALHGDLRAAILADLADADPDADAYKRRCHLATVLAAIKEAQS
ncbi:FAD binding domain-containing protein [Falsirhodobacter xinxiangensis]|uniref:FAD binding domain-containing protein n=1 Tax=Falsirhodobacter xinxiangensis TaxID=2530049 RepID=UPI0010AB3049|nr:FAD binding domain-containing protein [Rhodobacter xinxiangensis]